MSNNPRSMRCKARMCKLNCKILRYHICIYIYVYRWKCSWTICEYTDKLVLRDCVGCWTEPGLSGNICKFYGCVNGSVYRCIPDGGSCDVGRNSWKCGQEGKRENAGYSKNIQIDWRTARKIEIGMGEMAVNGGWFKYWGGRVYMWSVYEVVCIHYLYHWADGVSWYWLVGWTSLPGYTTSRYTVPNTIGIHCPNHLMILRQQSPPDFSLFLYLCRQKSTLNFIPKILKLNLFRTTHWKFV